MKILIAVDGSECGDVAVGEILNDPPVEGGLAKFGQAIKRAPAAYFDEINQHRNLSDAARPAKK
jgi:hypothetical protein